MLQLITEMGYYQWDEDVTTIWEAYVQDGLQGRYAPNLADEEMLDLIFENRVYDLGLIWDFGAITDKLLQNKSTDVVAMLASVENKVQDGIDDLMEAIGKYE